MPIHDSQNEAYTPLSDWLQSLRLKACVRTAFAPSTSGQASASPYNHWLRTKYQPPMRPATPKTIRLARSQLRSVQRCNRAAASNATKSVATNASMLVLESKPRPSSRPSQRDSRSALPGCMISFVTRQHKSAASIALRLSLLTADDRKIKPGRNARIAAHISAKDDLRVNRCAVA